MLLSVKETRISISCAGLGWRTHSEGPCSAAKTDRSVTQALDTLRFAIYGQ